MIEYEYSDAQTISSIGIRKALQSVSNKFQINSKACAVEVFEEILKIFHNIYNNCNKDCYTHGVFGFEFTEEISCQCNNSYKEIR